jgi:membrane associated rhomboid family serine protease
MEVRVIVRWFLSGMAPSYISKFLESLHAHDVLSWSTSGSIFGLFVYCVQVRDCRRFSGPIFVGWR